jgi:hypothetical protein
VIDEADLDSAIARMLKCLHLPRDVDPDVLKEISSGRVRWYVAHPLSLRHPEEMVAEHEIAVGHSTSSSKTIGQSNGRTPRCGSRNFAVPASFETEWGACA